ncbi:hypothetical protein SGRA_4203 [Saprospira grandis str. Lewin]|uniref:Uncharacterized protein n=1 Tax=Saprospira grandis (strain Lewin) TaxID=984262 RepID=H6L8W2_SAPGL|nr:hypothetical protein SGRA_4203 [Saprospira grandis str. Lewin]
MPKDTIFSFGPRIDRLKEGNNRLELAVNPGIACTFVQTKQTNS